MSNCSVRPLLPIAYNQQRDTRGSSAGSPKAPTPHPRRGASGVLSLNLDDAKSSLGGITSYVLSIESVGKDDRRLIVQVVVKFHIGTMLINCSRNNDQKQMLLEIEMIVKLIYYYD